MGVSLKDIITPEEITFQALKGKIIAVDALNFIYQFLASIRQPDGTPLMDSQGRVTSHLSGLLYRTIKLMNLGIKPVYVFDGEVPELKEEELEERKKRKEDAKKEWKKAIEEKRIGDAKKFAMRTSQFTPEMRKDSKKLLDLMGVPFVQAPSEGEAQCVHLCEKGDAWAVGSQDYDSLLLGARRLLRGLTLSKNAPLELILLEKNLKSLGITREQLVEIGILVGTDFNEGVKGIGPKTALKKVKEGKLEEIKRDFDLEFDFEKVKKLFLNPAVTDDYEIDFRETQEEELMDFLCEDHDFSEKRIESAVGNLKRGVGQISQKDLSSWF